VEKVVRIAAASVLVLLATGCSNGGLDEREPAPGTDAPVTTGAGGSETDLLLSFDEPLDSGGGQGYADARGRPFLGLVVVSNGGRVEPAPGVDGTGASVSFPSLCAAPTGCPRAMVEVAPDPALDAGEDVFEYGAAVWLAPDQTTTGSNIVQKGRFGTTGGQWKLQVDSLTGEPSCVVRSGPDVVVVRSKVSIADSTWHRVVCRRDLGSVTIRVDDSVDRREGPTGSVTSDEPVRVGSAGVGDGDDQFHGRIDDVFLRIER
jgi:hypothetical protein